MVLAAGAESSSNPLLTGAVAALIFVAVAVMIYFWWAPTKHFILRREVGYGQVLRGTLLMNVEPRSFTVLTFVLVVVFAMAGFWLFGQVLAALMFGAVGLAVPSVVLKFLKYRRAYKLDDQIVDGIQTLTSGVRAGLNLIQAMELLADSGVRPISDEFAHLLREYNHGVSIEQAMKNTVERMESSNYRLLFSALLTHRDRGGDLSETLTRIADSIREIHRLEKRIEALTAPGRAAARWMGAMPAVILAILYVIDPEGVTMLWTEDAGKLILGAIIAFNIVGFLWIKRIVSIDI